MPEIERIERIRRYLPRLGNAGLVLGIGDDCAIVRPRDAREDWLISTDLLVEGVHFSRDTHSPADAGYKALARGLSDIAAMGGVVRFCLVSLALPRWADDEWLDGFYEGLNELSGRTAAPVVGGDLARAGQFVCDVVACGAVPPDTAMRRDRARVGDLLYVSGSLGGSALGLAKGAGPPWNRHLRPEPRLQLGEMLRRQWGIRAAMDLSDGLSIDLHRLGRESGVSFAIDRPLPIFPEASETQALHGGEDYELVFTAPPETVIPAEEAGVALTRIGEVKSGPAGEVSYLGKPLEPKGWDHFRD